MDVSTTVENIKTLYDLTSILSTMTACTATFVAIIGGLIASKAISDRAEKDSIDRQLTQLDMEIDSINNSIDYLSNWINESDANDFISAHINELLDGKPLDEVYDHSDKNDIEFDDMLLYWNKATEAIDLFRSHISSERNKQGIPKDIVENLNSFQKDFCARYRHSIEDNEVALYEKCSIVSSSVEHSIVQFYNERIDELDEELKKKDLLIIRKQVLTEKRKELSTSHNVKHGINIFIIVSIVNIIIPVFIMLFNPTQNKGWFVAETVFSFITFSFGIIAMIIYICSLFPKKEKIENPDVKGAEHKDE